MSIDLETVAFAATSTFHGPQNDTVFRKRAVLVSRRKPRNLKEANSGPYMRHGHTVSRRTFNFASLAGLVTGFSFHHGMTTKADPVGSPFTKPDDLTKRLVTRLNVEPSTKLYQTDIFYPAYFAGLWQTESTLLRVECPAGYKLFGRPGSFEAAKEEINTPLRYKSRFIRSGRNVVSDRPFNVTSIAKASMGPFAVLNCSPIGSTPNRLTMTLRPNEADGAVFNVDLRVVGRHQQTGNIPENIETRFGVSTDNADRRSISIVDKASTSVVEKEDVSVLPGLYTSETTRQEVRPDSDDLRVRPLVKDVETTTVFVTDPKDERKIRGWQKTNVYIAKSDLRYPDARGRPVDVRWYRLNYSRE